MLQSFKYLQDVFADSGFVITEGDRMEYEIKRQETIQGMELFEECVQ